MHFKLISKISLIACIVVLFNTSFHFAQSDLNSRISIGLESLYNFNFKSANNIFDNIIKIYPDNPGGYYYKSISHLWFFLDNKSESELDYFLSLTDTAIEKATAILEKDSADLFVLYILGSTM
ncbi:MAG: hypothetical protein HXY48_04185 [Ignavibacteriaceae bacterium]|nr:hypothetical protein [Ignavibacteriaceae bacterium]